MFSSILNCQLGPLVTDLVGVIDLVGVTDLTDSTFASRYHADRQTIELLKQRVGDWRLIVLQHHTPNDAVYRTNEAGNKHTAAART